MTRGRARMEGLKATIWESHEECGENWREVTVQSSHLLGISAQLIFSYNVRVGQWAAKAVLFPGPQRFCVGAVHIAVVSDIKLSLLHTC